jgi:hypothetical protein
LRRLEGLQSLAQPRSRVGIGTRRTAESIAGQVTRGQRPGLGARPLLR